MIALLAALAGEPTPADLVWMNARLALRDGQPRDAARLWLLRNAHRDLTDEISSQDADFHSVTWAALGAMGVCQDGHPTDEAGAGLWPLALHNQVVLTRGRKPARKPNPFDGFALGRQQRFVTVGSSLSARELGAVTFFRGKCARPRAALIAAGEKINAELADRAVAARLLRYLLTRAKRTLAAGKIRGMAAVDARIFDIDLQLASLAARAAKRDQREAVREGRRIGMTREQIGEMSAEMPVTTLPADSEAARVLRACVSWPVDEWMAIEDERRRFLFQSARAYGGDPAALDAVALGVIDRLAATGRGEQVARWIAMRADADRAAIWKDERGLRLLGLDKEDGFRERAVLALHRGVHELSGGDLPASLRSFALAVQLAPESSAAEPTRALALRWLSYVAAQFALDDALLVTLQELLPPRDFSVILEDLLWGAALRADAASFERGVRAQRGRGALERRLEWLRPLASGDADGFTRGISAALAESPTETLRFLDQLVQRVELEDAAVRTALLPTLARLRDTLAPLATAEGRQGARSGELLDRIRAIGEGLGGLPDPTARDRARNLDPGREVFAGAVRLAPSDALPWPFPEVPAPPPPIFVPLELRPVEWRGPGGDWVYGWSLSG